MPLTPTQIQRVAAGVAGGRLALGVTVLIAPDLSLRIAGVGDAITPSERFFARLFAVREMVLGGIVLERLRFGVPEAPLLYLNAACDAGDALVILRSLRHRRRLGRLWLGLPTAVGAATSWIWIARSVTE